MDAKLVVVGGKASKGEVKLKLPTVLGRSRDAGLAIAHPNVSRRHCEIREVEGALIVRDLGSSNGTLVNDEEIQEVVLKPGDTLTVGPLVFRAEYKHTGKFPIIGKKAPKAATADTLEFSPDDVAPKADKPAVAKERKAGAPPPSPVPEAKKPAAPEVKKAKPADKDVETVVPGKLEKSSKPKERSSELDDLSLPDLDAFPGLEDLPTARSGKDADVEDLADLPPIEEPAASEWGDLESPLSQEEDNADLSLPLDMSESLPELSDDLDLPVPEADSLAEVPELESPGVTPPEMPADEPLESWSEAEEDLALSDELPPLEDEDVAVQEPAMELPVEESLEEFEPAREDAAAEPDDEPALAQAAPEEEPIDDLGLVNEMQLEEELPPESIAEEGAAPESPWAEELPAAEYEHPEVANVDDLPEMTLAETDEAAEVAKAEAEPNADELEDLGLADELPPIAEAASEVPMPKSLEPDPAWLDEEAGEQAELPAETAEVDDLPEMTLEAADESQEFAAAQEDEIEEDMDDLALAEPMPDQENRSDKFNWEPGDLQPVEESADSTDAESDGAAEEEVSDLAMDTSQETKDFLAVEEQIVEEEFEELRMGDVAEEESAASPPEAPALDPGVADLHQAPRVEHPTMADLEETIDVRPESHESWAEEKPQNLNPGSPATTDSTESPAPAVEEESELNWLDEGASESAAAKADDAANENLGEPSLEELGLDNRAVDDVPAVQGNLPAVPHEFTRVERSDPTEENLSSELTEASLTDHIEEEHLEFEEGPDELPEEAAELPEESVAESAEEAVEEMAAELPPAMPWQSEPDETAAWSPATEEPPPFSLQPEADRPAFTAGAPTGTAGAKLPEPTKKKKGWSLFGWLKKREKPTKASSAPSAVPAVPAPVAPLPFAAAIPEPSFEEAEAPAWSPESLPEEPPSVEFTPAFPEDEIEDALDLPEMKSPEPDLAELESELDAPHAVDAVGVPPTLEEPQWGDADLDEPEFAAVEPPLADLDESSGDIDIGALDADLAQLEDVSASESEPAESAKAAPALDELSEDLAPLESMEMESDEDELQPIETLGTAEPVDEELPDEIAPPELPPAAEHAELQEEPQGDIPWAEDLAMAPQVNQESPAPARDDQISDDPWADELAANAAAKESELPLAPLASASEQTWEAESAETDEPIAFAETSAESPALSESPTTKPAWQTEHEETVAWNPSTDDSPGFTLQAEENRPARYSEVEARAARANKPAAESAKKKGWSLFGWLKKKEKPAKASAPPVAPTPQFAAPPVESEPAFEDADELDELDELEPIADVPDWEPEPDELPEEAPPLEPVAEDLPPLEIKSDELPPLEDLAELPVAEEEVEELSEEVPPLGPAPEPHAAELHGEPADEEDATMQQDATMQWSGDVAQFEEEPEASAAAQPPIEPPVPAPLPATPPAAVEPSPDEDLPEFMQPKQAPKAVSGEDDDLNEFFQELGLK